MKSQPSTGAVAAQKSTLKTPNARTTRDSGTRKPVRSLLPTIASVETGAERRRSQLRSPPRAEKSVTPCEPEFQPSSSASKEIQSQNHRQSRRADPAP